MSLGSKIAHSLLLPAIEINSSAILAKALAEDDDGTVEVVNRKA